MKNKLGPLFNKLTSQLPFLDKAYGVNLDKWCLKSAQLKVIKCDYDLTITRPIQWGAKVLHIFSRIFFVAPLGEWDQFWNWSIWWNGVLQLLDFTKLTSSKFGPPIPQGDRKKNPEKMCKTFAHHCSLQQTDILPVLGLPQIGRLISLPSCVIHFQQTDIVCHCPLSGVLAFVREWRFAWFFKIWVHPKICSSWQVLVFNYIFGLYDRII